MERFTLSDSMIERLRAIQAEQMAHYDDPILRDHDAVVATYGLGPAVYLCLDGRVLSLDHDEDDPTLVQATDGYIMYSTLLILAKRYPLLAIEQLFPSRPAGAIECHLCGGTRWAGGKVVCPRCRALGWIAVDDKAI